jgi:pimeloyl-ACP methyl ester carboxylesterase
MAIPWISRVVAQKDGAEGTARRRLVSVRNGLFQVEVYEAGAGEPLVVLHDLSARQPWYPALDKLAMRYRVVAPLIPGFGASTGGDHIDDPVDAAFFLNDLLDALAIESANVLGNDLGGMFAAELAAMSPGRVRRLVLVSPLGLRVEGVEPVDLFAIDPGAVPGLLWHDLRCAEARAYEALPTDPAALEEATVLRARASGFQSKFTWPFPERGLHKRVHRLTAATLLVWGESDGFTPLALARAFLDRIPGSRLTTIAAAGHFPMLERPDEFVRAVSDFLG